MNIKTGGNVCNNRMKYDIMEPNESVFLDYVAAVETKC